MNFLIDQYKNDGSKLISHNYLLEQFSDNDEIFREIKELVIRGDFTLGQPVIDFENDVKEFCNAKNVISLGSGTDAISLSLKACGVGYGDEVITTPFTFYATIGAICSIGARPKFCDIGSDYNINPQNINNLITKKTKAIVPVHWSGEICDMMEINLIAEKNGLHVVQDACHAFGARLNGVHCGVHTNSIAAFSLHPLKNINCWGDGGFVITDSDEIADKLRLLRNHGLKDRDNCEIWGHNSRLDSLQAIVAKWLLKRVKNINQSRLKNAQILDSSLKDIREIRIPQRKHNVLHSYHLYSLLAHDRDGLVDYLRLHGVDAKVHYPLCMHLQPAAVGWGYKKGDFPVAESVASHTFSLPVHEFISEADIQKMVNLIKGFY
jgi:dTDP-4-amino-4,6-dideoxygalactose transaminase